KLSSKSIVCFGNSVSHMAPLSYNLDSIDPQARRNLSKWEAIKHQLRFTQETGQTNGRIALYWETEAVNEKVQKIDRFWRDYPIGTKAISATGGHWTKTKRGWKWETTGSTFPTPGGDAITVVLLVHGGAP